MPHRIALRHLVLGASVLGLAVLVWLNMVQLDRVWLRMGELKAAQAELRESVARLESSRAQPKPEAASPPGSDAWARPGVPVVQRQRPLWFSDPTGQPDFATGGTITEALEAEIPKITPYNSAVSATRRVTELVLQRLADYDPRSMKMQGVLASAWQPDPGLRWLRVRLRDDAVWSDGVPVTAEDVRFTLALILDKRYEAGRFRSTYDQVTSVDVLDEKTVELTFREPLYLNIDSALRLAPIPAHIYSRFTPEQFNSSTGLLLGCGPYMLKSFDPDRQWVPGSPIELARNPRYFGHRPPADTYRFVVIKDNAARATALDNREIDLMRPGIDQFIRARDAAIPGGPVPHAWLSVQAAPWGIVWNCGTRPGRAEPTPFADRLVRAAISTALDREHIVRDFFGSVAPCPSGPFRPGSDAYDPGVSVPVYDLANAASLLSRAGWIPPAHDARPTRNGVPLVFTLIYPAGNADAERVAVYVADQCRLLRVACTPQALDGTPFQGALRTRDFDAAIIGWSPDSAEPNPYQRFHSDSIRDGKDNASQWSHPEADRLIDAARRELDDDKRNALWRQLHRLLREEEPMSLLYLRPTMYLVSPRIGNFVTYPTGYESSEFYVRRP